MREEKEDTSFGLEQKGRKSKVSASRERARRHFSCLLPASHGSREYFNCNCRMVSRFSQTRSLCNPELLIFRGRSFYRSSAFFTPTCIHLPYKGSTHPAVPRFRKLRVDILLRAINGITPQVWCLLDLRGKVCYLKQLKMLESVEVLTKLL